MNKQEFTFKGTLEKGVSQKGNEYEYLSLKITDTYSMRVFLSEAEKILLLNNNKSANPFAK